jgi:hypothetical protein
VPAHERWPDGADPGSDCAGIGGNFGRWVMQKLTVGGDLGLAVGVGEQPMVSDPVKAGGQHVRQEAALSSA